MNQEPSRSVPNSGSESAQEVYKELIEEEIEKIIERVRETIMPFYDEIEALRKANPEREVGGRIRQGKLELFDESKWKKSSVVGESYEEERRMAKEDILSFHTHPDKSMANESAQDILSAYFRLNELIIHEYGITLLIALKELPIEEITKIDEQAWQDAQYKEEMYGDSAYWFWKGILNEKLPVRKIDIIDKLQISRDEKEIKD